MLVAGSVFLLCFKEQLIRESLTDVIEDSHFDMTFSKIEYERIFWRVVNGVGETRHLCVTLFVPDFAVSVILPYSSFALVCPCTHSSFFRSVPIVLLHSNSHHDCWSPFRASELSEKILVWSRLQKTFNK